MTYARFARALDESYFSFSLSSSGAGVTIQAVDLQALESLCPNATSTTTGRSHYTYDSESGYIIKAYVEILSTELTASNPTHLVDVSGGLGALLGLVEYSTPCPFAEDLMCGSSSNMNPSTLDLYAAHVLANGKPETIVTLPNNIPYQQASVVSIPEFDGTSILLLVLTLSSTLLLRKKSNYLVEKFEKDQS